jgi:hypothetical protein
MICSLLGRKGKAWKGFYIAALVMSRAGEGSLPLPRITGFDTNSILLLVKICAMWLKLFLWLNYFSPFVSVRNISDFE